MKDYSRPVLDGAGANDYGRYMRTDELLALQRDPEQVVHRDELLFQTVHQTTELWLKYACFEADEALTLMRAREHAGATRLLRRSANAIGELTAQLEMLLHLTPWSFQTVRTALGNGSGFESPGWQAVRKVGRRLSGAFEEVVASDGIDLVRLYRGDDRAPEYQLAEALIEWDDRVASWRGRHFKIVTRIIGRGAVGTKGAPVETLSRLIDQEFFPVLWQVRTDLTDSGPMAGLCPVDHESPLVRGYDAAEVNAPELVDDDHGGVVTSRTTHSAPVHEAFRQHFPALAGRTYLSSCALAPPCRAVDEALDEMRSEMTRGAAAWEAFEAQARTVRARFAALVGADVDQIALVPNASIGAYQVASTTRMGERYRIVTSALEFPSLAHVWLAQQPRGAETVFVDTRSGVVPGRPSAPGLAERYASRIDRSTALVSAPLVAYTTGELLPVADVVAAAHGVGAPVLVDAYQAVGVVPVDVGSLGCDFLVAGTQKYLLGLPGLAFLYVRDGTSSGREPTLTGWQARVDPSAFDPMTLDFATCARRFETGTPSVPAVYAANAGLALVQSAGVDVIRDHTSALVASAASALRDDGFAVEPVDPSRHGAHLIVTDPEADELAAALLAAGVSVSPRCGAVRVAFHLFNDGDDVEALRAQLARIRSDLTGETHDAR